MKKRLLIVGGVVMGAMAFVSSAFATVTVPTVDPSAYGDTLLSNLSAQLTAVLPYAAAFTAFAIGVGFIKGWIGRRKATSVAK
jgi:hypothetical protein